MPPRKVRRHGDLPANWQWRDGRPRWIPAPALRRAGWKGCDLKEGAKYLERGASIDRAGVINQAVAAWRAGERVPAQWSAIAPAGAAEMGGKGLPVKRDRLAIGALIEAYVGDKAAGVKPSDKFGQLAAATQRDYRNKLKRLVDVLAGYLELPKPGDGVALADYEAARAEIRGASVLILEPVETANGMQDPLHKAYHWMRREIGPHQASGVMAVASAWLAWCRERQSRTIRNWAAEVERETPPGRIRPASWDELTALVRAADRLGWLSMGDAIVLGVDLSWSQVDRLKLTWPRVKNGRCLTSRQKTGRVGGTPLSQLGRKRMAQILWRQRKMDAQPTHVLWCESTGAPWKEDHYRHVFALVRAEAAKDCPSVAGVTDADLRDTAITLARIAGLNNDQTASRSLQSRKRINDLMDQSYGEIGPEIADQGVALLDVYISRKGLKL